MTLLRPKSPSATGDYSTPSDRSFDALLWSLWAVTVLPGAVALLQRGRPATTAPGQAITSPLADVVTDLTISAVVVAALAYLASSRARPAPLVGLAALWAPWGAVALSTVLNGQSLAKPTFYAYLVVTFVVWLRPPAFAAVRRQLARVTLATAALSVGMALLPGAPGLMPAAGASLVSEQDDKAIIGDRLLAGPFNHGNELGIALALGTVFVFSSRSWRARCGQAIFVVSLLWSASRTSLLAAGLTVLVLLVLARGWIRRTGLIATTLWIVVIVLPLQTTDPESFTTRGRIWLASRSFWNRHELLGGGRDFYQLTLENVNQFGRWAFHGHNIFINAMTVGGVLNVIALGALVVVMTLRVNRTQTRGLSAFAVTLPAISLLETPFDVTSLSSGLAWGTVALLTTARGSSSSPVGDDATPTAIAAPSLRATYVSPIKRRPNTRTATQQFGKGGLP